MIKCFKLITNEEVIAEVLNEDREGFSIKNAMNLIPVPVGDGVRISMGPWLKFSSSTELKIKHDHILATGEVEDEVKNAYNSAFGSGIVTPPKLGIVAQEIITLSR